LEPTARPSGGPSLVMPASVNERAGLVADDEVSAVPAAIEDDPALTPRQRRSLLDVYEAFVAAGPAPRARKRRPRPADT
jgi:hypothetical protein